MSRKRLLSSPFFSVLCIEAAVSCPAFGEGTQVERALKMITDTANQICQSVPLEQTSSGLDLSGDAKAKLGGIAAKIADLGISGTVKYQSELSVGVLQKDLITAIQTSTNCKLEVFRTLERDLLGRHDSDSNPPPPSQGTVYPAPMTPQPQRVQPTQQSRQSVMIPAPAPERPTPSMPQPTPRSPTRQETLACKMMREQVLDYERTHRQIAALDRINYADRCQNAEGVPPPDETLRIRQGTQQFMYCVHWRDEILKAEAPQSSYAQMLARDQYMWNTAYCDHTDPPLATTH
jgi:hypothetical protein